MHAIETDAKLKPAYANIVDPSEDSLAHEFLGLLARRENYLADIEPEAVDLSDQFSGTIEQMLEDSDSIPGLGIRPDVAAIAILTARAIQAVPGLIGTLRQGTSVVSIATGKPEFVSLVSDVLRVCAFDDDIRTLKDGAIRSGRKRRVPYMVARDGTSSSHTSQKGNDLVVAAFHAERLVIGIAPDPKLQLPRALTRAADFHLAIGEIDESAIAFVIEAITGRKPSSTNLTKLIGTVSVDDINVAIHRRRTPDSCFERLNQMAHTPAGIDKGGPRLEDLAGYGAAKVWGLALAADLDAYKFGRLAWSDIDKGLLLDGPPGVGKTQYAKALARSARVPLIATSVAEWSAGNHLSGTLKSIKDVFERARKVAPSILFIDELDGISDRANLRGDYVEYWTQIVNLLLEQLSGIEDRPGVVVIGATNHSSRIDPAIRRSGRLDRTITIDLPDRNDLCEIFRFYLKRDLADTDLMPIALAARGGTGADVEAWVRRARAKARRNGQALTAEDIRLEIRDGRSNLPSRLRDIVCIHEAGHVVVGSALHHWIPDFVWLTDSGGRTIADVDLSSSVTLPGLDREITILLAGRAAEKIVFGACEVTTGAGSGDQSDLVRATQIAFDIEVRFGLGECGLVRLPDSSVEARFLDPLVQAAIGRRLENCLKKAETIIEQHLEAVQSVALNLGRQGYLDRAAIDEILQKNGVASPDLGCRSTQASIAGG
ncbi:cell division protease FtsH [Nitrobacteraceae bacterium AZCC 2161]